MGNGSARQQRNVVHLRTFFLIPGLWGLLMVPFFMSANRAVGERGIFFDGRI